MVNQKARNWKWLSVYSCFFLLGLLTWIVVLKLDGKAMMLASDGFKQHYTVLNYVGQVVRGLLAGKGYPMVSLSLGQGFDVLTTMSYYGFTDPISYLGIFVKDNGVELFYFITVFIRAYFAGLFFGLYAKTVGVKEQLPLACSAIIYVFSGYFILLMRMHPYFLNGGLYLPLLLIGIERIFKERKWLMFTLITALMLIVNFYFAYMNTIVAIVYILVRLSARFKSRGISESAKDGFILLGGWILGAAISAVVFIPIVKLYLNNSRLNLKVGYQGSLLHYPLQHYSTFFSSMFLPGKKPHYYSRLGFIPISLFGFIGFIGARGKQKTQALVGLLICFIVSCIPVFGYIMNGGAYVSNRWIYALALFFALCSGLGLQHINRHKNKLRFIAAPAIVFAFLLCVGIYKIKLYKAVFVPVLMILQSMVLLAYDHGSIEWLNWKNVQKVTAALLAVSCVAFIVVEYTSIGSYGNEDLIDRGVLQTIDNNTLGNKTEDDGVYRVNQYCHDDPHSSIKGYMGTSYYWSLIDSKITKYYQSLWLPTQTKSHQIYGLGASAYINAVASVKYYVQQAGTGGVVPYGFEKVETKAPFEQYENQYALPIAYCYDRMLTEAAYNALPVEDRLQALVQYAICDDGEAEIQQPAFLSGAIHVPYTLGEMKDIEISDHSIKVHEGSSFELKFNTPEDYEAYLVIRGIKIVKSSDSMIGAFTVISDAGKALASISDRRSNFYCPQDGVAICLGHGELKSCELISDRAKEYTYDSFDICCVPLSDYRLYAEQRRSEGMVNVEVSNNRLTGYVHPQGKRVLQIAIPYSTGWRAWVDNVEQPLFRCGGMYMGLNLDAGEHHIELRYVTPGLKAGLTVSFGALLLTMALAVLSAVLRRKGRENLQ